MASVPQKVISKHSTSKGFALIISNDYCDTPSQLDLPPLAGTKKDAQQMASAFKTLNIVTLCEHNLTRARLMQLVYETAQSTNYPRESTCIAFVFSGHGYERNHLYMQDGKKVKIEQLVEQFLPRKAPKIANIPKLFFIDACRGDQEMHSITVPKGIAGLKVRGGKSISLEVPPEGNYLLAYSTMPCYRSYEFQGEGGIWMTTLARRLRAAADRGESIEDILTAVNEDLIQRYQSHEWKTQVQQPEKISRLNKRVYLGPQKETSLPPITWAPGHESKKKEVQDQSIRSPPTGKKQASATSKNPTGGLGKSGEVTSGSKRSKSSASKVVPHLSGDTPKEKLESYCEQVGKPPPTYSYSRLSAKSFEGTVYVAQTCGRVTGEKRTTKANAEEEAAAVLLEKLGY